MLEQVSVFAENKKGRLAAIIKLAADNGVDVRAVSIADTTDFGIVRMIVDDPKKALRVFRENNCIASCADVIGFRIADRLGAVYEVVKLLDDNDINIQYCYSLMGKDKGIADIVIMTEENHRAEAVLRDNGIELI